VSAVVGGVTAHRWALRDSEGGVVVRVVRLMEFWTVVMHQIARTVPGVCEVR